MQIRAAHDNKKDGGNLHAFFLIYYLIITAVFLLLFFLKGTECGYVSRSLGKASDRRLTLTDDDTLAFSYRISEERFAGITLDDYYDNDQDFTDEYIIADVYNADTDKLLQSTRIELADQYSESIYHTDLYIPIEKDLPIGTNLLIRISSSGLDEEGILFGLSDAAEEMSVTMFNGKVLTGQAINASAYFRTETSIRINIFVIYIAGCTAGIILLLLERFFNLPVMPEKKKNSHDSVWLKLKGFLLSFSRFNGKRKLQTVFRVAFMVMLFVVFWNYVYKYAVERASYRQDADFIGTDSSDTPSSIFLGDGDQLEQTVEATMDEFSGLGVCFGEGMDFENDNTGYLKINVLSTDTDELLAQHVYELADLKDFDNVNPLQMTNAESDVLEDYKWLDFGTSFHNSKGRLYKIVLSVSDSAEPLEIRTFYGRGFAGYPLKDSYGFRFDSLSCIILYRTDGFLTKLYWLMAGLLTAFACVLYLMHAVGRIKAETMFLIAALVAGIIVSFLIPPFCVPDERAHVDSVYVVSDELMGISTDAGPSRILKRVCDIDDSVDNTMDVSTERYRSIHEGLFEKADNTDLKSVYVRVAFDNASKLHYLPAAIGFTVARLLGLNCVTMVMFGRWMNLLMTVLAVYAAIRTAPFGKCIFALTGMIPMYLQQGASCSYDALINASVCLFLALVLRAAVTSQKKDCLLIWVFLLLTGSLIAVSKGGAYMPVLFTALLIPACRNENRGKYMKIIILAAVVIACVFLSQYAARLTGMLSVKSGSVSRSISGDSAVSLYTMEDFARQPGRLIGILENTFYVYGDSLFSGILGSRLAKLNVNVPWLVLTGEVVLLMLSVLPEKEETRGTVSAWPFFCWGLCAIGSILLMLSMLLSWTEAGTEYVQGLQGRYFIPYFILFLVSFSGRRVAVRRVKDTLLIFLMFVLVSVIFGNCVLSIFA